MVRRRPTIDRNEAKTYESAIVDSTSHERATATFWAKRDRYQKAGFTSANAHARGSAVSTIRAGMFDLDAIIAGK